MAVEVIELEKIRCCHWESKHFEQILVKIVIIFTRAESIVTQGMSKYKGSSF